MARFNPAPTVKISDGKGGYKVINESDFDKKTHKEFAPAPAPDPKGNEKGGKK